MVRFNEFRVGHSVKISKVLRMSRSGHLGIDFASRVF